MIHKKSCTIQNKVKYITKKQPNSNQLGKFMRNTIRDTWGVQFWTFLPKPSNTPKRFSQNFPKQNSLFLGIFTENENQWQGARSRNYSLDLGGLKGSWVFCWGFWIYLVDHPSSLHPRNLLPLRCSCLHLVDLYGKLIYVYIHISVCIYIYTHHTLIPWVWFTPPKI